eukprot:bmy_15985T0
MAPRLGIFLIWAGASVFLQLDPVNGDQQLSENTTVSFAVTPGNGCVFPFIYGGKTYFDCAIRGSIFRWCALNVDYIGRWKYCTRKGRCAVYPHTMPNVPFPLSIEAKYTKVAQKLGVFFGG